MSDGADMDGKPLTILDSGMERIDSHTIQGFQEVKLRMVLSQRMCFRLT